MPETLLRDYTLNRANRKVMAALSEQVPQGEQRNRLMEIVDNREVLGEYTERNPEDWSEYER